MSVPAPSTMDLRRTEADESLGCPISRAFFAREVGIFACAAAT